MTLICDLQCMHTSLYSISDVLSPPLITLFDIEKRDIQNSVLCLR